VSLFVDYDSGFKEKQGIIEGHYLFPWAILSLEYKKKDQFEERLFGLVQWSLEELSVRDASGQSKEE
jgi:hypothetical protein